MRGTRRIAVATTALLITAGASLTTAGAAAAGAAAQPTGATKQWCTQVKQIAEDFGDPGIDAIFDGNPNPTLAQWAAFLPGPIARMQKFSDDLEASDPPKAMAADVKAVVKRWTAVIALYTAAQKAAAAGDQKVFDASEGKKDPLINKLGKAMNTVGKACGFTGDGGS